MENNLPLNTFHVHKSSIIINRSHMLIHSIAIAFLIYYRASNILFQQNLPTLPWILVFVSELLLSFNWFLSQAHLWRPVYRKVYPDRLPEDENLPAIDVFICTVDPEKEPTVGVMNTVISAMALDYPPEKLHVYLSDDGGFPVTLYGMKEAWRFAKWWIPFCRRYGIEIGCPDAYLSREDDGLSSDVFLKDKNTIKEKYDMFKENITRFGASSDDKTSNSSREDHPTVIEQIVQEIDNGTVAEDQIKMPLLVYVAREKKRTRRHNFKAGALNVLLRVSGVISNSPYILGLDCDMYCNDPTSAKKAMCLHLDPKISPSLAFVQFSHRFHNINFINDIYDAQLRIFWLMGKGMDGLEGPLLCGTNYYIKRESFYGNGPGQGLNLMNLKSSFGSSKEFIKTLLGNYKPNTRDSHTLRTLLHENADLASCTYEDDTNWGEKVGFRYFSVVEDCFTGFHMQCKGWKSVFLEPSRPQFLGTATTNLNDLLIQGTRWGSGLSEVALSRFCPLIYGISKTSFLQNMCYTETYFFNLLCCLSVWCLAIIPPICFLNGIPLYPKVSSLYFKVFSFIFVSSLTKHLYEVLNDNGSILTWRNEARMWMIKSCTCYLYGSLDAIMKKLKLREASFVATSKVDGDDHIELYKKGMFDFQTSTVLLTPLVTLVILNVVAFVGGVVRVMFVGNLDRMLIHVVLSFYVLVLSYVVIEGMIIRNDKGKISRFVTMLSSFLVSFLLFLGYVLLV